MRLPASKPATAVPVVNALGGVGTPPRRARCFEPPPHAADITLLYRASKPCRPGIALTDELNTIAPAAPLLVTLPHAGIALPPGAPGPSLSAQPHPSTACSATSKNIDIYLLRPSRHDRIAVRRALHRELGVNDADIHDETFTF